MTTKTNTKPVTKSTDTDKFNVVTATKGLIEKGDRYNQAAIACPLSRRLGRKDPSWRGYQVGR